MFISPTILTLSLMFYTVTAHSIKMCWSKFNPSTYGLGLQQYRIKHSIQLNFWIPRENCISTHHSCIPDTTTAIETANLFFILQLQLKGDTSDMQGIVLSIVSLILFQLFQLVGGNGEFRHYVQHSITIHKHPGRGTNCGRSQYCSRKQYKPDNSI